MGGIPTVPFGEALWAATRQFLIDEGCIFGFPKTNFAAEMTLEEGVWLRDYLHRKRRFLSNDERLLPLWREALIAALSRVAESLPGSTFVEDADQARRSDAFAGMLSAPLVDLCDNPAQTVEDAAVALFAENVRLAGLFAETRERIDRSLFKFSGVPWEKRHESSKPLMFPTKARGLSNTELVDTYLSGTGFTHLFKERVPFSIPFPARFEHTVIVGGSGHGKTQLLQLLIHHDLIQSADDKRSIIIMDSQGDLIRTISHLSCFGTEDERSLADRFALIDPNDVEHPVCLNMFDWNRDRLSHYAAVDREKILNGTIEMYEYMFGALLGAELTQRQGLIFKYLARLMMEIPDATIHTLRELMENGEPFREYMEKLPGTARSFFETRFFDRSFNETKKQILTRLWGVLSNATLERMFSHPRNKVDIYEAMNSGKIVLINTAKELLKQDGCAIFGRFFIALISQAALERAALPPHKRNPVFVYIDEAADYFDQNIENLLSQARKYRVGMIFAHQNLDQLTAGLRSSVLSNTSIKFAGGVSAKDASAFSSEMRCGSEFLQSMRKQKNETEFACYVRNLTPQAISVTVPLGYVESLPAIADENFQTLLASNRTRYCTTTAEIEALYHVPPRPQFGTDKAASADRQKETRREAEAAPPPVRPQPTHAEETAPAVPPPIVVVEQPSPEAVAGPRKSIVPRELPPLGRGGKEHKYLQQFVKQEAERLGFRAVIEEPILDGTGRVDVALSIAEKRLACEISITTANEHELGNIEKCLAAGYGEVVLISSGARRLAALKKFVLPHIDEAVHERVRFLSIEDFIGYLEELSASVAPSETLVRGYKVRTTRKMLGEEEAKARRQTIAQVIARSIKQLRDD